MDRTSINSSSADNVSVETLKQRLADIPLVHKPSISDTDHAVMCSEILKQTHSCHSYFCHLANKSLFPKLHQSSTLISKLREILTKFEPESVPETRQKSKRSDESESSPKSLMIPADKWLIGGTLGSRNSTLVFRSSALAGASVESIRSKPAHKLHITYKVMQAETKLLAKLLDCHGVSEVSVDSHDFNLLWTGSHPKPGLFRSLSSHQKINHFPRSYELTRKDRLYKNIERMQHSKGLRNFDFVPQTFIMPGDFKELCSVHYRVRGPWIVKPVASSRGRGIFIVETPYQVPLDEPVVVAKYICNPLLVGGHKCDLRLYVAVTSYDPLLIYIYEEGLVRFATVKYDTSHKQLWNPCMHLCNYSINKYHSDYIKSDDPCAENVGHKWTLSALLRHLKTMGKDTIHLMAQIEDIVVKAIITSANSIISACQMFVPNQTNCFELFGFDVLIDQDLKPWLLEVNLSPSLGCDSPLDVRLKSAMLADLLTLIGMPAVDPILKPVHGNSPVKASSMLKMKLGACRRVHSADGLSQSAKRYTSVGHGGRLTTSTYCLSPEESRLIKLSKAQFERRGGWVRIFPTAESWTKYSQYLDPVSGIPSSAIPSTTSCHLVIQHNYNHVLHTHLFPDVPKLSTAAKGTVTQKVVINASTTHAVGQRHHRYERQLNRGHRTTSLDPTKKPHSKLQSEEFKLQVCAMLKGGKVLT